MYNSSPRLRRPVRLKHYSKKRAASASVLLSQQARISLGAVLTTVPFVNAANQCTALTSMRTSYGDIPREV